ncbi:MAG: hypothetical protein H6645_03700 [Caldilineaceae bacterium]|nr:hypothetical protein [Caldilineaceae bacterium]
MHTHQLRRVYWLGGSPCAGKSTVSEMIAEQLGWQVYHCDDWDEVHRARADVVKHPTFHAVTKLRGDALWLRPVEEQLATEIRFHGEQLALVLEDLPQILATDERPLLVEGSAPLPHLLTPLLPNRHHAFWLIPTETFQRYYYAQRPWVPGQLATTSNPAQAFENWMQRDAAFARWLEGQVAHDNLEWWQVDGTISIEETAELVTKHFCPMLPNAPV